MWNQQLDFNYRPQQQIVPGEGLFQGMQEAIAQRMAERKSQQEEQSQHFLNRLNELKGKSMEEELADLPAKRKAEQEEHESKLKEREAHAKYFEHGGSKGGVSGSLWRSLPQNTRNDIIAQGAAWGLSPEVVAAHIGSGGTMEQLKEEARAKGVDVESAPKIYTPTTSDISRMHTRQSRAAEVEAVAEKITPDISVYGMTWKGHSPGLILDMTKAQAGNKEAEERVIRFLGANALQPEVAAGRIAVMGGSQGIELMKEAMNKALSEFKVPTTLMTPAIREGVNRYMQRMIQLGLKASIGPITGQKEGKKANEKFGEMAGTKVPHEMSEEELQAIINGE